ncbi:unnamed protein product [Zymoseptoria tritici ST99CH_1A5]|uniref:Uncharacterized protein n=1 Tax=Zymoseptoria tritici ST99CH_1A5 TaxID=1276529 RepID=A0A1Y6M5J8_ZYMTR|nr:unnamed protein product [Zymoseptoria tritici ST99CH_1A5]
MSEPLRILEPLILRHLGAILEGDIFSILASSPFIIRSSEFALSDGALDCTRSYGTTTSFAERFWSLVSHRPTDLSEIVLFDAKSSSVVDGDRIFYTSLGQRHGVGFHVCICGTDPDFVELIPNYQQKRAAFEPGFEVADEEQDIYTVNVRREYRLFGNAHGHLDQYGAAYRMPVAMLPAAIERVRACAQGKGNYINPWTKVEFEGWCPMTTHRTKWIKPREDADNAALFLRFCRYSKYSASMSQWIWTLLVSSLAWRDSRSCRRASSWRRSTSYSTRSKAASALLASS